MLLACTHANAATVDCDGEPTRVLQPAAHAATDARAYWLDDARIRWPKQPADARYRLVASAAAGLRAQPGKPVAGADRAFVLDAASTVPEASAERFGFVGDGASLALPDDARAALRELLRGQVLLVREDARGNVADATYLQTPGALDVLYAAADSDPSPLGATPGRGATANTDRLSAC